MERFRQENALEPNQRRKPMHRTMNAADASKDSSVIAIQ